MKRILVTAASSFSDEYERSYEVEYIPFININIYPKDQIIPQIPEDVQAFIVTSKNSAKAIKNIELNGQFFVVGKSTAQELYGQDREITFISNYSEDLLERMLETDIKKYVFFKGNLSLTNLPDVLKKNGVEVIGIESYKTILTPHKIDKYYDGIVFMSPSAVRSFTSVNEIPKETIIFTSGKTTAETVKKLGDYKIYYPEETTKESLLALINDTIDA
ncbi:MAG: uroporphyrinogen-III synthase [Flavobacteriaceae bacterium]|jgi:uroporphyrinogen-III synthase|nr:uroporphyrinogen-III synthase [Flavobacteriaceae bacterium]